MEFWAAISIGLFGSFHCLGMCGPIALALPLKRSSSFHIITGSVLYNLGRLCTYSFLGMLLGSLGKSASFFGLQQGISILAGLVIIASVFVSSRQIRFPFFGTWLGKLKTSMAKKFSRKSFTNLFLIGVLNGLLPCGLVYIALIGAIAIQSSLMGGLFMLLFGLGTLPMLLLVNLFGGSLKTHLFPSIRRLIPLFIILIGSLFILRGMGLGVPYISPNVSPISETVKCH